LRITLSNWIIAVGFVGVERLDKPKRERHLRGPGESYSDVILRLVEMEARSQSGTASLIRVNAGEALHASHPDECNLARPRAPLATGRSSRLHSPVRAHPGRSPARRSRMAA
jgi:hypothetical protein